MVGRMVQSAESHALNVVKAGSCVNANLGRLWLKLARFVNTFTMPSRCLVGVLTSEKPPCGISDLLRLRPAQC